MIIVWPGCLQSSAIFPKYCFLIALYSGFVDNTLMNEEKYKFTSRVQKRFLCWDRWTFLEGWINEFVWNMTEKTICCVIFLRLKNVVYIFSILVSCLNFTELKYNFNFLPKLKKTLYLFWPNYVQILCKCYF